MDEVRDILNALARVETKLDFHKETLDAYERRLASLEKKYWTTLGAAMLSLLSMVDRFLP